MVDEVIAAEARVKNISTLANRIQTEIDGYVVEMRLQYPNAQFPSIDAHELISTISSVQVKLSSVAYFQEFFYEPLLL